MLVAHADLRSIVAKEIELRRHADNHGDVLSAEGVRTALALGRRSDTEVAVVVTSGAQRATQTAACMLASGRVRATSGVLVNTGLQSPREQHWRELAREVGGGDLVAIRRADPRFVAVEATSLARALREVLAALEDGQRALVIGHSPTNEAAILGLTGHEIAPMAKGAGVLVIAEEGTFTVMPLDP
jgi:phosphohistidine phosphatase SixA